MNFVYIDGTEMWNSPLSVRCWNYYEGIFDKVEHDHGQPCRGRV
nr:MAG TPA: hypothetical protein [Caudoviricetes sp.]